MSVIFAALVTVTPASAHANLMRAVPAPNSINPQTPSEIRLWFTEPLEAEFSRIVLYDSVGRVVTTPASQIAANDAHQMYLTLDTLPDGLYTISWRVVSSADGHPTQGSFPIVIGAAAGDVGAVTPLAGRETIPLEPTFIRWLNFLSMALTVGSLAFWLFVWNPALPSSDTRRGGSETLPHPNIEARMTALIWAGWGLLGLSGLLVLLMQFSSATGSPLLNAISDPALGRLISNTRFGNVWILRMAQWAGLGLALFFARSDRFFYYVALVCGGGLILTTSLYSHASAAPDTFASIAADWLHLTASVLWIGGLIQFVNVIGPVRRHFPQSETNVLSSLVGYFTIFARVAVATLIVTGLYAAWLHVGSVNGLLTTLYGQALLVKLLLFLPLLGIAGINLFFTHRGLQAGKSLWATRLRGLVSAEIALTIGILAAVGVMTSIAPARNTLEARAAELRASLPDPYYDSFFIEDGDNQFHVDLEIKPGWVGENTFNVYLYNHEGAPIDDASLIRLRFDHQSANLGTSELRPESQGNGVYTIAGANLGVPGQWRIRATIQRPNQYDTVLDFEPNIPPAPEVDLSALEQSAAPLTDRVPILLLTGALALGIGGFFLGETGFRFRRRGDLLGRPFKAISNFAIALLLALGLMFVGLALLVTGVQAAQPAPESLNTANAVPIKVFAKYQSPLPYLLTIEGVLLRPNDDGTWRAMQPGVKVTDAWLDPTKDLIWAATEAGLRVYIDSEWQIVDSQPAQRVLNVHGFMVTLGEGHQLTRIPGGPNLEFEHLLHPDLPLPGQPAVNMAMMGSHQYVLLNGDKLFLTPNEGLEWIPLESPEPVALIAPDADNNLLAVTADGLLLWNYETKAWRDLLPLPDGQAITALEVFQKRIYALASGKLYRQAGNTWSQVELPGANNTLTAMKFQYPDTFWVLAGTTLWKSTDGENWSTTQIRIAST
jgi:copper transport protein